MVSPQLFPPYSERYYDDVYEYRHVVLPPEIAKRVPKGRLMSEVGRTGSGGREGRGSRLTRASSLTYGDPL